jgi:hypothetical protein
MKTKILIIFSLILTLSACEKKDVTSLEECQKMAKDMDKLNHDHFINCASSCFKVAYLALPKVSADKRKEEIKNNCVVSCRENIDFDILNNIKQKLDQKYDCHFDYVKKMAH